MKEHFDEVLSFELPYGYEVVQGVNDEGNEFFNILCGVGFNDEGEQTSELRVSVRRLEGEIGDDKKNLNADLPAMILGTISEIGFGIQLGSSMSTSNRSLTMQVLALIAGVSAGGKTYALIMPKVGKESAFEENTELLERHLNMLLGCMYLNGKTPGAEHVTAWRIQQVLRERSVKDKGDGEFDLNLDLGSASKPAARPAPSQPTPAPQPIPEAPKETPEEKARRLEAERAAAEEEKAKAEAYERWKAECRATERKREEAVEKAKAARKASLRQSAETGRDGELAVVDKMKAAAEEEKKKAETTLAGLGVFKFAEKKQQRAIIERITSTTLPELEKKRTEARQKCEAAIAEIERTVNGELEAMRHDAQRQFPLPPEPPKPESMLRKEREEREAQEARLAKMTSQQRENERLSEAIVEYLKDSEPMTISDMIESIPELYGDSNMHVSALCRALVLCGRLEKFTQLRRTYFKSID